MVHRRGFELRSSACKADAITSISPADRSFSSGVVVVTSPLDAEDRGLNPRW